MLEAPRILAVDAQQTAVIHLTIPPERMPEVVGPGIGELFAALAEQGVAPTGPWFIHMLRPPAETFDFEIGIPVSASVRAAGRVEPGQLRAGRVARTVHRGPYEGLPEAWAEFAAWIDAQGLSAAETLWESYAAGPESGSDPWKWRTELTRLLL